jgi:hypothetical protein
MYRTNTHRHSIFCILPPHLLNALAQRGTPQQRARALRTLLTDNTFRSLRAGLQLGVPTVRRRPGMLGFEGQKQRTIYDAHQTETLPGVVVRSEGSPSTGDPAVDEAYDGLGATFDFFWEVYHRNLIDDEGLPMLATVHFGGEYNNAFWNSERMVFGDGDGELCNGFTTSLDVVGHELTHGVTEDEAQLLYFGQPGALNESVSDVFGSLVKQYLRKQTAHQADWLIGAGLFTASVNGLALRSMKAPGTAYDDPILGKDPQPAHMSDFVRTFEDNGGVHINSGIPNRAFYLAATQIGGYAWEKTGRIWYETLRDSQLRSDSDFRHFAGLTIVHAEQLFGASSLEGQAVRTAWSQVGIDIERVERMVASKIHPKIDVAKFCMDVSTEEDYGRRAQVEFEQIFEALGGIANLYRESVIKLGSVELEVQTIEAFVSDYVPRTAILQEIQNCAGIDIQRAESVFGAMQNVLRANFVKHEIHEPGKPLILPPLGSMEVIDIVRSTYLLRYRDPTADNTAQFGL